MTTIRIPKSNSIPVVQIEPSSVSSSDPQMQRRMARIADNYQQLDNMLNEIEFRIQSNERLKEIDDSIQEVELNVEGQRRRWRPRRSKSASPRKPR